MSTLDDREGILLRIERIQGLLSELERTSNESEENRLAFEKLKRELRAAHRTLVPYRPDGF